MKVLIVDDEPLARERISTLLSNFSDVEIVAECANGEEALAAIEIGSPDLMFLDVQMPEMDGLSIINSQVNNPLPLVIFVTAYADYGLAAFDSHAVDYLLKPFDQKRFEIALQKARARLAVKTSASPDLPEIVGRLERSANYRKHISIRQDGRLFLVKIEEIEWVAAEKNYVRLHVGAQSYLRRDAIGYIEQQLDPELFRRVHRSTIINLNFIKELRQPVNGDYRIILSNGEELTLSSTYQKNLLEFFD
ncbi:MAG TPA: LytTR family DNA-binding domain-containing protein [Pyrinomonadaceae bacterium]|jgi:two-component system LytT family response regulator